MRAADGELEVKVRSAKAQHSPIETIVVCKASKLFQAKALPVLRNSTTKVAHWTCDSQMNAHGWGVGGCGLCVAIAAGGFPVHRA